MLPLASSATHASMTADSAVSCTTSCTGWTFLSGCSTSCVQPSIDVCSPKHHIPHDGLLHPHLRHCSSPASAVRCCHQLFVPRHRRSMFGRRAFFVAGPAACNSLPDCLRDLSRSFDSFRLDLKTTFLYSLYTAQQRHCNYY